MSTTKQQKQSGLTSPEKSGWVRNDLARELLSVLADCDKRGEHVHGPDLNRALLTDAVRARASDIHVEPRSVGAVLRFRIDGGLVDVATLTALQSKWIVNQMKAIANLDPIVRFSPKDAHASAVVEGVRLGLRLALAPCQFGEVLSIRLLNPGQLERRISELGLTKGTLAQIEDWLERISGMFLAAGPTGSGKTTTVYALLHELKQTERAIVTLEDPVEFEIDGIVQVQLDEKHHLNFGEGVKSMLRLDPDYLMLGEIRDAVSAHAAVNAAISGRVLLSTIHCRDAVGAVTALRNWAMKDHEIAESISVVVAQRLVRKLCLECCQKAAVTEAEIKWLKHFHLRPPAQVWKPVGCRKCNQLGYWGRTGIFELWQLDEGDYRLILDHCDEHALRQHLGEREHVTLVQDGLSKVAECVTSMAELKRVTGNGI